MWLEPDGVTLNLGAVGFALLLLAYGVYAAQLHRGGVLKAPLERPARALLGAVAATIAWAVAGLVDLGSTKVASWHVAVALDHARYLGWLLFMLALIRPVGAPTGRGRGDRWPWALGAVGLAANVAAAFGGAGAHKLLAAAQLAFAVAGLVGIEQLFRNQDESSRWAAKPLCLGLAGIFVYDLYLFAQAVMLSSIDHDVQDARALVQAATVPLLMLATRRSPGWITTLRVSKSAAFYSASLLLAGGYLLLVAGAGYYVRFFGGSWGGALQVALIAVALTGLAVLLLSGAQRARVRVFVSKHFFRYRYDYRVEWLRFTTMLAASATPGEVNLQVVRGLADLVESPAGSLWLRSLGQTEFVPIVTWNLPPLAASEAADSALSRRMAADNWIVDFAAPDAAAMRPAWIDGAGPVWLAVPLLVGDDLLGFVLLAHPRTPIGLDWEVRDLLKTAARQAAGVLALMHATEALMEARKFDAFNRMSAFVVHDLKNIVTQLSLMMKNAERHRDNPEFQQDMLNTVANSLEKMKQMMLQLREGERPEGVTSGVELAPLLARLQEAARRRGREVGLEVCERLSTRGHEQRLERVIDHVVQNALDATPASGTVSIRLDRAGGRARVAVSDTGAGMTQEFIRTRLFRPFNSTKTHGMGIGSYESLQYMNELGGSIDVNSEPGRGSVVTLLLPLFDHRHQSDLSGAQLAH